MGRRWRNGGAWRLVAAVPLRSLALQAVRSRPTVAYVYIRLKVDDDSTVVIRLVDALRRWRLLRRLAWQLQPAGSCRVTYYLRFIQPVVTCSKRIVVISSSTTVL